MAIFKQNDLQLAAFGVEKDLDCERINKDAD
jgi:hypothetical protein